MANICDTNILIKKSENDTRDFNEITPDIIKDINEHCAYDGELSVGFEDETFFEGYMSTRWSVPVENLQVICKKYGVQCRADGRETGVGFIQLVEINEKGEIITDDELAFSM